MTLRHNLLIALSTVTLVACAATPRVQVDRVDGADLVGAQRFALVRDRITSDDEAYGPAARDAAETALVGALRARGLEAVEIPAEADLLIAVGVLSGQETRAGQVGVTPGHTYVVRRRSALRTPLGDIPLREDREISHRPSSLDDSPGIASPTRQLRVDVFEADGDRLVWRGKSRMRSRSRIDPDEVRERVRAIVGEFP